MYNKKIHDIIIIIITNGQIRTSAAGPLADVQVLDSNNNNFV